MIKEVAQKIKNFFASSFRPGRKSLAAAFFVTFLVGYNMSLIRLGDAYYVAPIIPAGGPAICTTCDVVGETSLITTGLAASLHTELLASATELEAAIYGADLTLLEAFIIHLDKTEWIFVKWWKLMWYTELKPALQKMTNQMVVFTAHQSKTRQLMADAQGQMETTNEIQMSEVEAHRMSRPAENTTMEATLAGGQSRAAMFSRAMRSAWEADSLDVGLNRVSTVGSTGIAGAESQRYKDYKTIFCNPDNSTGCTASDSKYYDADTQPTKFIYNKLTIPFDPAQDPDGKMNKTISTILNNMVGVPSANPISIGALKSAGGQQTFLDRRAYLARYGAVRSVPQLVTSWRVPGSGAEKWVKELRKGAGIPDSEISNNPSYREIMHALTIDRFNGGKYAGGLITDQTGIEMEKLTLDAFYLMQLRDYYELLERTALTLAVQVSMMTEQVPVPDAVSAAPLK